MKRLLFFAVLFLLIISFFICCSQKGNDTVENNDVVEHNDTIENNNIVENTTDNLLDKDTLQQLEFKHNGLKRTCLLFRPAGLAPNAPLVFMLHGATQTNQWPLRYTGMNKVAQKHKFAVCYPQGTVSRLKKTHWNAHLTVSETDDIGFLTGLAAALQTTYKLNPKRTFIAGLSNGGFMGYTFACEAQDVFRAMASVAGTMSGYDWKNCNTSKPIPVLEIHGYEDVTVPLDGSMSTENGWGGAPPLDSVMRYWAKLNNCNMVADTVKFPPSTTAYYYRNGTNGNEVWYYKVETLIHGWPSGQNNLGLDASTVIWDFFSKY